MANDPNNPDPGGLLSLMQTGGVPPGMMLPGTQNELNQAGQWLGDPNSLPASMNTADPYGGRTMKDIIIGGLPGAQDVDANNNPYGDAAAQAFGAEWQNRPATNELVSAAIAQGGKYNPQFANTLQSSGPQGGYFSIPSQSESNYTWGLHTDPRSDPAPGLMGMSTNNWRLLPEGFQSPGNMMRAGHIINRYWTDKPLAYAGSHGAEGAPWNLGGPGHGFPTSIGSPSQRGYFFPGQIEPWLYEGGPGTT